MRSDDSADVMGHRVILDRLADIQAQLEAMGAPSPWKSRELQQQRLQREAEERGVRTAACKGQLEAAGVTNPVLLNRLALHGYDGSEPWTEEQFRAIRAVGTKGVAVLRGLGLVREDASHAER